MSEGAFNHYTCTGCKVHLRECDAFRRRQVTECFEGRKDDNDKPRWDLLPPVALASVVDVLSYGAKKYAPENWRMVAGWRWRYFRAALGHLYAWWRGESIDPESRLPHLAHAACCVLFLLELVEDKGNTQ
jgi:hypothetical protein